MQRDTTERALGRSATTNHGLGDYTTTRPKHRHVTGGTNLAFGGADGKTVLVVGMGRQVRELQMNVPGLP